MYQYNVSSFKTGIFSQLQSNNHTLPHFLKQTYFLEILEKLSLETPDFCARYYFLINMFVGLYIYHIFITFLRGLVKHIENKNQLARSNFEALETVLCLMSL